MIIHFIRTSAVNSRAFKAMREEMSSGYTHLLFRLLNPFVQSEKN